MTQKYFGTDGIRGEANRFPMTAKMALKIAMATALALKQDNGGLHQNRVVIGKDTRLSGYMLEQAMAAGFEAMGIDVIFLGPVPTPAVAMLTRSMRADCGVMISASHNPYQDNGIKLFGADGYKLAGDVETKIETLIDTNLDEESAAPDAMGKAWRLDDAAGRYVEYIKGSFPRGENLAGLRVVIDCAHGAAYKVAPQILWELEAEVIKIGADPDGRNINHDVGATATQSLCARVVEEKADIGLALDGDADRIIMVDETGREINGDQIMSVLALYMKEQGTLRADAVVATVMSNLGMEKFLESKGLTLVRTPVGDRHVVERMRADGYNLGGEQSGHIILGDYSTTGDGLLAALQALAILKKSRAPASQALRLFTRFPQILENVKINNGARPLDHAAVKKAIAEAEKTLANDGRLVVRESGTEPLVRVMAEGRDPELIKTVVTDLCRTIEGV